MGYLVSCKGRGGITLFLVDRTKTKKRWWETDASSPLTMIFRQEDSARTQANKLRYKEPTVITYSEALELSRENDHISIENDVHPFSSEGLGQS